MCYKRLWRTNKKSLFSFKRQSKITQQGGLWKRKWQNNSWNDSMCTSICTRITQEKILKLRDCKNASLCNKDIQVMYTRVYLDWSLYRIKLFWQLSTDFRLPVCLTLSWSYTEKWRRLTLRSTIDSLIFSLQLGHLFFRWWYFLLANVSGWRMKQPTSDW